MKQEKYDKYVSYLDVVSLCVIPNGWKSYMQLKYITYFFVFTQKQNQ